MKLYRRIIFAAALAAAIADTSTLRAQQEAERRALRDIYPDISAALRAEPAAQLRAALDAVYKAGNYRWTLSDDGGRIGDGKTIIGSYTSANIVGTEVVCLGREVVYRVEAGWRHASDLTDADISRSRSKKTVPAMPHEVVSILMENAEDVFRIKDSSYIVIPINRELKIADIELFIRSGRPLHEADRVRPITPPSVLPSLAKVRSRAVDARDDKVEMLCDIVGGKLVRITVEFTYTIPEKRQKREHRISIGDGRELIFTPPESWQRGYHFEISDIGTTTVEVDPEVEAILSVSTSRR